MTASLTKVKASIAALKAKLPASGPAYHSELTTGLTELDEAATLGLDGIAKKDRAKLEQFGAKASSAQTHLSAWEKAVRGN